jgi:hypothetical protein
MAYRLNTTPKNTVIDAHTALFNKGAFSNPASLNFYSNATSPPTNPGDALPGGSVLLSSVNFANTAFGSASAGVATANSLPISGAISNTGTCSWFRSVDGGGTVLGDGTVTATGGGGDIVFNSTSFIAGGSVQINTLTMSVP